MPAHARRKTRALLAALLGAAAAAALALALLAPGGQARGRTVHPQLVSPKARAVVPRGHAPVFKVRDTTFKHRYNGIFLIVARNPHLIRHGSRRGELKYKSGSDDFHGMSRVRGQRYLFAYRPHVYTFPDFYLERPGRYYWQVFRIDCLHSATCHVLSRVRSFVVR